MREERTFEALGVVRLAKIEKWVMPPGHPPVFEHLVSIWLDGLAAGLALDGDDQPVLPAEARAALTLPAGLYARLESPDVFTEYDEFPALNDRDFEDLSIARVGSLIRRAQPGSHPEVSAIAAALWVDGVGTALRFLRVGNVQLQQV